MSEALTAGLLDDDTLLAAIDPAEALGAVESSPQQWEDARGIVDFELDLRRTDAVVVAGMGGSGIAADVVAVLARDRLPVPVIVHKGFGLPGFVGRRTVVVAISYSGQTEETLSAAERAVERGATLVSISSADALVAGASANLHVTVPGGLQPRHACGYLTVPALTVLGLAAGVDEAVAAQRQVLADCGRAVPTMANPAKRLGLRLAEAFPVCYGTGGLGTVAARRLVCQLQEHAKLPAYHAELPELAHNEILAWQERSPFEGVATVVWVRDRSGEDPRVAARVPLVERAVGARARGSDTIAARGQAALARIAALLLNADLVSVYAAIARGQDPTPIRGVSDLKAALGR